MMMRQKNFCGIFSSASMLTSLLVALAGLTLAGLTGCASANQEQRNSPTSALTQNIDEGVLIANTANVGPTNAEQITAAPSDCHGGQGVGVSLHSAIQDSKMIFDKHGRPCPPADVLYDGKFKVFQRAAPLGIDIKFSDPYAEQLLQTEPDIGASATAPFKLDNLAPSQSARKSVPQVMPETAAGLPVPQPSQEHGQDAENMPPMISAIADQMKEQADAKKNKGKPDLYNTIHDFRENEERDALLKATESMLADVRSAKRKSSLSQIRKEREQVLELTAKLREAEREAQYYQQQKNKTQKEAQNTAAILESKTANAYANNNKLNQQVETLQARIREFDKYNQNLKEKYQQRQQQLQERIAHLSADLKETKSRSKATRQAAILQAATQIAEAEKIAFAAQISQRKELEMEAQRLQMQALQLSDKAQELPDKMPEDTGPDGLEKVYSSMVAGRIRDGDVSRLANIVINGRATADGLGDATFAVEMEDKPLKEIFERIMEDVKHIAGNWRIDWKLLPENSHIPDEKWVVTAESTVNDFISYVAKQVYKEHDVKLAFKMFGKKRVVVITEKS